LETTVAWTKVKIAKMRYGIHFEDKANPFAQFLVPLSKVVFKPENNF
jgi:hypothetical protein